MTFQIGKFYKAGKDTENFIQGSKLLCVDFDKSDVRFYGKERDSEESDCWWESLENCEDLEEWREPREFTLDVGENGRWVIEPASSVKPGETIKLREVL